MGVSVWCFLRPRPGDLCPLPQRAVFDFISNAGRLPADAEGFVRYAEVVVSLQNRRATEVLRVAFFQYRALKDGTLDREHFQEILAAIPEAAFGGMLIFRPPPGVIHAEHRFAKRRLEHLNKWKPTTDDLSKLRDLVNRRARLEIM